MQILSWNVQNGIDAYGVTQSLQQCQYLLEKKADVLALQEVDQHLLCHLKQHLPDYQWCFAPAISSYQQGKLRQFGNVIGVKKDILIQYRTHCLLPVETTATQHMPRSVVEVVVQVNDQYRRILTCHLEFFCPNQRRTQIRQIDGIIHAAYVLAQSPSQAKKGLYQPLPLPVEAIICGDFNIAETSSEYDEHFAHNEAWRDLGLSAPLPTCGLVDVDQWPHGADRRDYFFTNDRAMKGTVYTDIETTLSDHQPIVLTITSS